MAQPQQQRGQNAQVKPPGGACHHIQMQQRRGEGDARLPDNAQQGFQWSAC